MVALPMPAQLKVEKVKQSVNEEYLQLLLMKPYLLKAIQDRGTHDRFKDPSCYNLEQKLREYSELPLDKNGMRTVSYRFTAGKILPGSRLYEDGLLQGCHRELCDILISDTHCDLDIELCHPTMASQIAKTLGISTPTLDQYVKDRTGFISEITDNCELDKHEAKKYIQAILYGATVQKRATTPSLLALSQEARLFAGKICEELPQLHEHRVKAIEAENSRKSPEECKYKDPKSSASAVYMQYVENGCLKGIYDACIKHKLQPQVLKFDGLHPVGLAENLPKGLLAECMCNIKKATGLDLNVRPKDMQKRTWAEIEDEFGPKRKRGDDAKGASKGACLDWALIDAEVEGHSNNDFDWRTGIDNTAAECTPEQERENEQLKKFFTEGELGLARAVHLLRFDCLRNIGDDGSDADFIRYNPQTCIWERIAAASTIMVQEIAPLTQRLTVTIKPLEEELDNLSKKCEELRIQNIKVPKEKLDEMQRLREEFTLFTQLQKSLTQKSTLHNVYVLLCSTVRDEEFGLLLDQQEDTLSVINGMVEFKTQTLRPRVKEDYMTYAIQHNFQGSFSKHPQRQQIVDFLAQITLKRAALEESLQRHLGYSITGWNAELLMLFLGEGANGKGAIGDSLSKLLGPNLFYTLNASTLAACKTASGSGACSDVMAFKGKRIAIADETLEGPLNNQFMKTVSGGAKLGGRELYTKQDSGGFKMDCTIVLFANKMPEMKVDAALVRRIRIFPFDAKFREDNPLSALPYDEDDPTHFRRDDEFKKNFPHNAFLSWLIEGAHKYYTSGFGTLPDCCLEASRSFQDENDALQAWLDSDGSHLFEEQEVPCGAALAQFNSWRIKTPSVSGTVTKTEFAKFMLEKGWAKNRSKKNIFRDQQVFIRF